MVGDEMIGRETRERILSTCKVHGSDSDINIAAFHLLCNQLIELGSAEGRAEARKFMVQIFTDPENQPSQYGTVTLEYMQREIEAEREACAQVCERDDSMRWAGAAEAIRTRGEK